MAKIVSEVHHYMAHFFSQTDKDVTKKRCKSKNWSLRLCSLLAQQHSGSAAQTSSVVCMKKKPCRRRVLMCLPYFLQLSQDFFWPRIMAQKLVNLSPVRKHGVILLLTYPFPSACFYYILVLGDYFACLTDSWDSIQKAFLYFYIPALVQIYMKKIQIEVDSNKAGIS